MKHSSRGFSKKKLFPNAVRITNVEGKRVWSFDGKEYTSLRSILNMVVEEVDKAKKKQKDGNKTLQTLK